MTSSPMRAGRRPVKRLDLSAMREVLRDQRQWVAIGTVIQPDGEADAQHWEAASDDAGGVTDILVEAVISPANVEVTARLNMAGLIEVPDVGDEVVIVFPDGQIDWMPVIVARLSTGAVPNPGGGDAPAPRTIVICPRAGGHVVVHDGSGGTERLVKLSEHQALEAHVDQHRHAYIDIPPSGTPAPALTSPPTKNIAGTPLDGAPAATGTEVLRSS